MFISHTTVTLKGGQDHLNWSKNACSVFCHNSKFERNQSLIVEMQANFFFFFKPQNHLYRFLSFGIDQPLNTACILTFILIS